MTENFSTSAHEYENAGELIRLAGVVHDSVTDGPGIRFTVFTQGCPHHCAGCHNAHTWDAAGGEDWSTLRLIEEVSKNPLTRGVTLSGGDPMMQAERLLPFAQFVKGKGLELACYTGFLFEQVVADPAMRRLLSYCDILVDGPFVIIQKSLGLKFKGSSNQRVIDVQKSLQSGKVILCTDERWV